MATFSHRTFAGGEIAPALWARIDVEKYQSGLGLCRNWIVQKHGGVTVRPGTEHVGVGKRQVGNDNTDNDSKIRLLPFQFSVDQTYVLAVGDSYFEIIRNGSYAYDFSFSIALWRSDDGWCNMTSASKQEAFRNGDTVRIHQTKNSSVDERDLLIGSRQWLGPTTCRCKFYDPATGDLVLPSTHLGTGFMSHRARVDVPWQGEDLFRLRHSQSADILTVANDNYPIIEVQRTDHSKWSAPNFDPSKYPTPAKLARVPSVGSDATSQDGRPDDNQWIKYCVTVVNVDGIESLPRYSKYMVQPTWNNKITGDPLDGGVGQNCYTSGNGQRILTNAGIGFSYIVDGCARKFRFENTLFRPDDILQISGYDYNNKAINEQITLAQYTSETANKLQVDTLNHYKSISKIMSSIHIDITARNLDIYMSDEDHDNITLNWANPNTGEEPYTYRVYKSTGGHYGLIGETDELFFYDPGLDPDYESQQPTGYNPFPGTPGARRKANYENAPLCVGRYQQRRIFGGTDKNPEGIWASRTGEPGSFNKRGLLTPADPFNFTMDGSMVNRIQHVLALSRLLVFTNTGEWYVNGDQAGGLTWDQINMQQLSYFGSGDLRPIAVGNNALFVQPRGTIVRDLAGSFQSTGYQGNDLTAFAGHLFRYKQLNDWAYQQAPDSLVWAVRDDGVLLCLTYVQEQQIFAWHKHVFCDGDGADTAEVESVCVVAEGEGAEMMDRVYLSVKRTIDGNVVRSVERMSRPYFTDNEEYRVMDSSVSHDMWTDTSATGTMETSSYGGSTWAVGQTVQMDTSVSTFNTMNVGDEIHTGSYGSVQAKISITTIVGSTEARGTVTAIGTESAFREYAGLTWSPALKTLTGLWHLEGCSVSVIGDENVLHSPNNADYPTATVADGTLVMSAAATVIHVGLPITADFETLDIDSRNGETYTDKRKLVSKVTMNFENTRGLFVGNSEPTGDDPIEGLTEFKLRDDEDYDESTDPITGHSEITIEPEWTGGGRVFVRQIDPLPATVLAVHPSLTVTRRNTRER